MKASPPALLFVYNADGGLFNTMADIGHKIFSPSTYACALCALTHGWFRERAAWREFVAQLPCECRFLHRDEFVHQHPGDATALPAVFVLADDGLRCCADAPTIAACADLDALQALITQCCARLAQDGNI